MMKISMTMNSNIAVIITAAGSSTRMGSGIKKEYLPYKNGTVLTGSAKTFLNSICKNYHLTDFIITCPPQGIEACKKILSGDKQFVELCNSIKVEPLVVEGSVTRQSSVFNALSAVKGNPEIVLIHDGARPFVTEQIIFDGIETALEYGASVPGVTPTDTQKSIDENGFVVEHLVRANLCAVQTPQCFNFEKLLLAHVQAKKDDREYTDDTEVWGMYNPASPVKVYKGDVNNIKITYASDLQSLEEK